MPSKPITVHEGAAQVFHEALLGDKRLELPAKVLELAEKTTFDPSTISEPYLPIPLKFTESSAGLWALASTYANAIVRERFGIEQSVSVNTDLASLFLASGLLARVDGKPLTDPGLVARYQDDRFFHLHGSLNPDKTLSMVGLPLDRPELTDEREIINEYSKTIAQYDSHWLDIESNERLRQAGTICLTPDEFLASEQGKAIADDPIYLLEQSDEDSLPPILDLSRVIAAPTISKLAALYGATVVRVSCSTEPELGFLLVDGNLGKHDTTINLKSPEGRQQLLGLLQDADVVVDGYRPGALDKLGFGYRYLQEVGRRRGKGIILVKENCYGWHGPETHRSGWQQISDCFTGVSWLMGKFLKLDEPVVPPLPNSDYQTGIIGLIGILAAVDRRANQGGSFLVRVSLNQYNRFLLSLGEYPEETLAALRGQHADLELRHYHTIFIAVEKLLCSLRKSVPTLFQAAYWGDIKSQYGKGDGESETLTYVRAPTTFEKTNLGYDVGSCFPGTYEPVWPSTSG
ncbi:CoA-transferase family III domain-containing protein [Ilyonectria sp. MPI-CAGE-AT-0026]|nr:CoA-transferase family III domain-containing protein [Ilyonectria sp. MPI-CAGE-AT-0026]